VTKGVFIYKEYAMENDNLTQQELDELKAARDGVAWDALCDKIRAARGGSYPSDWYSKVIAPGLAPSAIIHIMGYANPK
jgi:hypothetical protein